ncbi:PAS domain S-box protein [Methylocapsa sp. D3K7]|uniref:PAS domain S-box protein n=1 Tax=Methylocapsa sp. D3K7 TaxID=3041435 RepID=UPI00244E8788|nr:PAS domain S-box protein [Methylocapsa sp. D3K7]WGJ15277.1 PAS domain S-box protein [Methylocapsa sp. D3K7]
MALSDLSEDARYGRLVEAMAKHYITDLAGIVRSWNANAQRFDGYEALEIIGCTFRDSYTGNFENQVWRMHKDDMRFWAHVVDPIRERIDCWLLQDHTRSYGAERENALQKCEQPFRLCAGRDPHPTASSAACLRG